MPHLERKKVHQSTLFLTVVRRKKINVKNEEMKNCTKEQWKMELRNSSDEEGNGCRTDGNKNDLENDTYVQKSVNVAGNGPCVAMYRFVVPNGCTKLAFM